MRLIKINHEAISRAEGHVHALMVGCCEAFHSCRCNRRRCYEYGHNHNNITNCLGNLGGGLSHSAGIIETRTPPSVGDARRQQPALTVIRLIAKIGKA